MDLGKNYDPCAFDTLFRINVPHILEKIFFSLDYKSFKKCKEVNKTWRGLLSTASYQKESEKIIIEEKKNGMKLGIAAHDGKTEEVRSLISSHNVDVNFEYGKYYSTPLVEAAAKGHNEIVQILLDSGADIDKGDYCSRTPLWFSAWCGRCDVMETLLDGGADPNKADEYGRTPLQCVARNGRNDVTKTKGIQLLIDRGAKPNKADAYGRYPLYYAKRQCRPEVIRILGYYHTMTALEESTTGSLLVVLFAILVAKLFLC